MCLLLLTSWDVLACLRTSSLPVFFWGWRSFFVQLQEEMQYKDISYVPALYKVFDEMLVNAADNLQRDPKMKVLRIP